MFTEEYCYEKELESSRQEGRKEGMQKGFYGMESVMIEKGYSLEEIREIVKLSKEKIALS